MSKLFPNHSSHPLMADLGDDAADVLCCIYLAHPLREQMALPDAEFVKAMADLQHHGFIRIVADVIEGDEVFRIEVAPFRETVG